MEWGQLLCPHPKHHVLKTYAIYAHRARLEDVTFHLQQQNPKTRLLEVDHSFFAPCWICVAVVCTFLLVEWTPSDTYRKSWSPALGGFNSISHIQSTYCTILFYYIPIKLLFIYIPQKKKHQRIGVAHLRLYVNIYIMYGVLSSCIPNFAWQAPHSCLVLSDSSWYSNPTLPKTNTNQPIWGSFWGCSAWTG